MSRRCRYLALFLLLAAQPAAGNPFVEQTITLRPGWNSVYVEVEPQPNDIGSVFAGIPVSRVWTPIPRPSTVEYIQDPDEDLFNQPGWLGYLPNEEPFLQSLFTVQANRPYLIRLEGDQDFPLTLTGRPSLRDIDWVPDSFNLVGLPVGPQSAITFGNYFAPSPAHSGQSVYRLAAEGVWVPIDVSTTTIRAGEAYWIFSRGASTYTGPLAVDVELSDGLDFAGAALERTIRIGTLGGANAALLRLLPSTNPVPLAYFRLDAVGKIVWSDLPASLPIELSQDAKTPLRLAVRRADFGSDRVEGVLELSDGGGYRRLIPISADRRQIPPVPASASASASTVHTGPDDDPFAGLWVGLATIDAVSEAQTGSTLPTPTASEFGIRLIVHVDAAGGVRLLKHVIQMWEDGTLNPDGTVAAPGHFVLLSDDDRIPEFQGASLRDGDPVGFRVSTAAYSFDGNELPMTGSFDPSSVLSCDLELLPDAPTHPFKHRFHPDHDNLDPNFVAFREEAFAITRHMELQFSSTDPLGQDPPDWGDTVVGGAYRETLSGVHRNDIVVSGVFRFRRVADNPVLNP